MLISCQLSVALCPVYLNLHCSRWSGERQCVQGHPLQVTDLKRECLATIRLLILTVVNFGSVHSSLVQDSQYSKSKRCNLGTISSKHTELPTSLGLHQVRVNSLSRAAVNPGGRELKRMGIVYVLLRGQKRSLDSPYGVHSLSFCSTL